jgi:hypothetical protein
MLIPCISLAVHAPEQSIAIIIDVGFYHSITPTREIQDVATIEGINICTCSRTLLSELKPFELMNHYAV